MGIGTGDRAPEFDLEDAHGARIRLSDYRGRKNVLLVFHPFAWTGICTEEALDLQANIESFASADTEVLLVSCDASPARQAWKQDIGATYAFPSDFWSHGAAARAYGVFDEESGAAVRGTFLIDKDGLVVWSLVADPGTRRERMVPDSLGSLDSPR